MKKQILCVAALAAMPFAAASAMAAGYSDDFSSIDPGWVTDRYPVDSISSAGGAMNLTVANSSGPAGRPPAFSGAFYNTQGVQHAADLTASSWTATERMWIDSSFVSGSEGGRRGDFWLRTSNATSDESFAEYYIIGARSFDTSDPFNASAANITSSFRVWDADTANGWVDVATPVTAGWHDFTIAYTGSSIKFSIDNTLVYTDNTVSANANHVTTVFNQVYNFGNASEGGYTVKFDDLNIAADESQPVPEPSTYIGALALASLAARKLRKKR